MTCLTITVAVRFSAAIGDVAAQAVALANRLNVNVRFDFNGTTCFAVPGSTAGEVVRAWEASRPAPTGPEGT